MNAPVTRVAFQDKTVTLTGSSQQALAANYGRVFLMVQNVGSGLATVNLTGGTAVAGGSGCVDLSAKSGSTPGGSLVLDRAVPMGAINVIGTAAQLLSIIEGTE